MSVDYISLYRTWLTVYSIAFTFIPIVFVLEWRKRKTAEGFTSVNFVLALFITNCWLKYGVMTLDATTTRIHSINTVLLSLYVLTYAYYQPKRKFLYGQLSVVTTAIAVVHLYVDSLDTSSRNSTMGTIAAVAQILRNVGAAYEIARIIRLKTTEYVPAVFQFALFVHMTQWTIFGIITENVYIMRANLIGLVVVATTIAMYFIYPPLTWKVPIIGTGPQKKSE